MIKTSFDQSNQGFSNIENHSINRILLPLSGNPFELLAIEVAGRIAQNHRATITVLHNNIDSLDENISKLNKFSIKYHEKITEIVDLPTAILKEANNEYELLVLPSRRRNNWIDKFFRKRNFEKVIFKINYDILQIFPSKHQYQRVDSSILNFSSLSVILSRTHSDPRMISLANSLASFKENDVKIYYIADLPKITSLSGAMNTYPIIMERHDFETSMDEYREIFSTKIQVKFIVAHNISKYASWVLNKTKPDIAFVGQTKNKAWYHIRSMSKRILDWTDGPLIVHYQSNSISEDHALIDSAKR